MQEKVNTTATTTIELKKVKMVQPKISHNLNQILIREQEEVTKTSNGYHQVLRFSTFTANTLIVGFFTSLQVAGVDAKIYINSKPYSKENALEILKDNYAMFYSEIHELNENNKRIDPMVERNFAESDDLLKSVENGDLALFKIEFLVKIQADNLDDLVKKKANVIAVGKSHNMKITIDHLNQKNGLLKTLGVEHKNVRYNKQALTTDSLVGMLPLIHRNKMILSALLGQYALTNEAFGVDFKPHALRNYGIFGESGYGKTHLSILFISWLLLNGIRCIVIDPKQQTREYEPTVNYLGGTYLDLSPNSKWSINIMSMEYLELLTKLILPKFGTEGQRELSEGEIKANLTKVIKSKDPTFTHFAKLLKENGIDNPDDKLFDFINEEGKFYKKFDDVTQLEISHLTTFYVGNLAENQKDVVMEILTSYFEKYIYDPKQPTQLIIDEAHRLCGSGIISRLIREVRSSGGGVTFISQMYMDIYKDLNQSNVNMEKSGLTNFACLFFFKQGLGANREVYADAGLNDEYINGIFNMAIGECVTITPTGASKIYTFDIPNTNIKPTVSDVSKKIKIIERVNPLHVRTV
jgi:type IV secretory pathway VirB4 component